MSMTRVIFYNFQATMSDPQDRFSDGPPNPSESESHLSSLKATPQTLKDDDLLKQSPDVSALPEYISALSELRQKVESTPLTQNLRIITVDKKAVSHIKELNAFEIKETLLSIIQKNISQISGKQQRYQTSPTRSENLREQRSVKKTQDCDKNGKDLLEEVVLQLSTSLRKKQNLKLIYKYIQFEWVPTIVSQFIDTLSIEIQEQELIQQESAEQNCIKQNESIESINLSSSVVPTQILAQLNKVENKGVALKLFSFFSSLFQSLSQKETQIQDFSAMTQDLKSLISNQIDCIEALNSQNQFLRLKQQQNCDEYTAFQQRCDYLEQELYNTVELVTLLKQEAKKEAKEVPYYINPLYQKEKLEQKYMGEIIQLQSDICLQRNRIGSLVDLVIQQIKMTHKAFYELGASGYFIYQFDKILSRKFKMLKPFDGVNLDQVLMLKEEQWQQDSENLYKSTISTFSSISMQKLQFSREDESLSENG